MNKSLTHNLTSPLIAKIIGAFACLVVLVLSLTVIGISSVNRVKDDINIRAEVDIEAQAAFSLTNDVLNEKSAYLLALNTHQNNDNFSRYSAAFISDIGPLLNYSAETAALLDEHNHLTSLVSQALDALSAGDAAKAHFVQPQVEQSASRLSDLLNQVLREKFQQADQARQHTLNISHDAAGLMAIGAFFTLLMTGVIIWFVLAQVLAPLRRLNEHLAQLLWGQTEHLTDRLNLLQYEIVNYNDMLTVVRHDLKSPLSSIKGLAELTLILHPDLTGEIADNLNSIMQVSDGSVSLISNVLTRRETRLDLQETNLGEMIDKVLQLVDLRFYNVQRKVEVETAVIDAGLMEHALLNLISNARKFSERGMGVGVQRSRKAGTLATQEYEFWVWNDGTVINAEQRNEIFKPGVQTDDGKKVGGHGLGLAIVKNIAELHHGRVSVDSHIKVGTTFRITIPTLLANPKPNIEQSSPPLPLILSEAHLLEV